VDATLERLTQYPTKGDTRMARFVPGRDQEVRSADPILEVMVDRTHPLAVGKHTFQLVVTDDSGNNSEPAVVSVIVLDTDRPTAVIDVLNSAGNAVPAPVRLGVGEKFTLSGRRSSDVGGTVKTWTWTLLPD
jgi:hypothetical protein